MNTSIRLRELAQSPLWQLMNQAGEDFFCQDATELPELFRQQRIARTYTEPLHRGGERSS
jgi:hypothetical protein